MCDKTKCKKIVSTIIKGNRFVDIDEDGGEWWPVEGQYQGPVRYRSGNEICGFGWHGPGLCWL